MERGIFGLKKDPRNPMLFSFSVKEGEEWPSSDSEDSDYIPSDQEEGTDTSASRKRKMGNTPKYSSNKKGSKGKAAKKPRNTSPKVAKQQQKQHKNKAKCLPGTNMTEGDDLRRNKETIVDGRYVCDAWGSMIPPEILLKIFQCSVSQGRSLPFLCRAAKVCRLWRDTSHHPSLWSEMDLSYGWIKKQEKYLQWLCEHRFARLEGINLGGWANLTHSGIEMLTNHCTGLKSVNLSQCKKLNSIAITTLAKRCTSLERVYLHSMPTDAVNPASLKCLIKESGPNLTHLDLSGNNLKGFGSVFIAIMDNCASITSFDLSNVLFSTEVLTIPIEKLHVCCPSLTNISLANSPIFAAYASKKVQEGSPGFPELRALSVAVRNIKLHSAGLGIDDNFLSRMLRASCGLRLLDVRGCSRLSAECLHRLPATDINHLYLSQMKFDKLHLLTAKWRHSLVELDISWNGFSDEVLDASLESLGKDPATSKLENLDLSGTSVTVGAVKHVLNGCPKLDSINLTSCRSLPRGMKREYRGSQEINKLKEDMNGKSNLGY